jgi:Holin of 3TMs, for gene-transfer release
MKGILGKLAGATGEGIAKPIEAAGTLLDDVFTSDEERLDKKTALARVKLSPYLRSFDAAIAELATGDPYTMRARPRVLHTFCTVLLIDKGILPGLFWAVQIFRPETPPPPAVLDSGLIMAAVAGVLGLGFIGGRTVEKVKGKA